MNLEFDRRTGGHRHNRCLPEISRCAIGKVNLVVYCWTTILTAISGFIVMLIGNSSRWGEVLQFLALGLALLFPIGLVVEYARPRWTVPRPVLLCIIATGLWICVLTRYDWR